MAQLLLYTYLYLFTLNIKVDLLLVDVFFLSDEPNMGKIRSLVMAVLRQFQSGKLLS